MMSHFGLRLLRFTDMIPPAHEDKEQYQASMPLDKELDDRGVRRLLHRRPWCLDWILSGTK
jgi:hypothetical protein